jgi:glycosyltransferase involved in cell wall biosynthesis
MSNKISVITPSYNSGQYIAECIQSVLAQGQIVSKHIIIDGGSKDGSAETIESYTKQNSNIIYIAEKDNGQADALNKGLALVDTPYFGWLNADDRYVPDILSQLFSLTKDRNFDELSIVYGNYRLIDIKGNIIGFRKQPTFTYFDCLYSYLTIHNGAALFNTELTKKAGGFNGGLKFAMDYDLILKITKGKQVLHIKEFISDFRLHPSSKTSNLENIRIEETKRLRKFFSQHSNLTVYLLNKFSLMKIALRMFREKIFFDRVKRWLK